MTDKEMTSLFEGVKSELLTEEVKKKLATLIEAKVAEQATAKIEQLDEKFEEFKEKEAERLETKAVEFVDTVLVERLNEYLDYVADEYVKENKLAIENGLGKMQYEKLAASLKDVLAEASIPTHEVSKIEEATKQLEKAQAEVKTLNEKALAYKRSAVGAKAVAIFENVSAELSLSQKEKLKKLAGHLDIDDLAQFKEKLETIKEHLIDGKALTNPSAAPKKSLTESTQKKDEENDGADTKAPFQFRPEGSPNGAFANIPDLADLL